MPLSSQSFGHHNKLLFRGERKNEKDDSFNKKRRKERRVASEQWTIVHSGIMYAFKTWFEYASGENCHMHSQATKNAHCFNSSRSLLMEYKMTVIGRGGEINCHVHGDIFIDSRKDTATHELEASIQMTAGLMCHLLNRCISPVE